MFFRNTVSTIFFGEIIVIALQKIFDQKKYIVKLGISVLIGMSAGLYIYFAKDYLSSFAIIMAFTYLALIVWLLIKNKDKVKFNIKFIFGFIIAFLFMLSFCVSKLTNNGVIEIKEYTENSGLVSLFSYGYSMFLPFVNLEHNELYSSFLSLFPVSLIVAMIYVYKREKHIEFLMPMIIAITLESIFCMLINTVYIHIETCATAVGLSCIYLYMYMLANVDEKIFSIKSAFRITIAFLIFYFLIPKPAIFNSKIYMYVLSSVIALLYFLFLNFGDTRYKKVLVVVLVIWTLISSVSVYPMKLIKGNVQDNIVQEQTEGNVN